MVNNMITVVVVLVLTVLGAYACYALWDNHQIYQAAEDVQADMLRLKPAVDEEGPSFEELLEINPDVCAWICMDNTGIDFPVLQGETNLTYINTDVYGNFSLAGSLFLDTRCDRTYNDLYSLIYGHHMENGSMFGDLDLYKEVDFFEENRTGTLITPEKELELLTVACLLVEASEDFVFDPELWQEDLSEFLLFLRENAIHADEKILQELEELVEKAKTDQTMETPQLLVLSTCSSEFSNARTILVTVQKETESKAEETE